MTDFIGRKAELATLERLLVSPTASMLVVKGRRRIGKSRLIEEFAKRHTFYRFSGLPPTGETTAQGQLDEFAAQLAAALNLPGIKADDWHPLFHLLARHCSSGRIIILLDEISWMGSKDPDFLGKLKNAWDMYFKQNPKLILVICGSVSSWIDKNILSSTGYLGRPSMILTLQELPLAESAEFWRTQRKQVAAYEKFKLLSVTGGVPRYLELMQPKVSAEENIRDFCFVEEGPLFNEFEHIFSDVFAKRSSIYKKIVQILVSGIKDADTIAERMGASRSGMLSEYLDDLVESGFVSRDYTWNVATKSVSKLSHYRLRDNYLRFYLKYVLPNRRKIEKGDFRERSLNLLPGWDSIMGLQFENLVLHNHHHLLKLLGIKMDNVVFCNPYFQKKTLKHEACQIDYMIQTTANCVYVCEIKFSRDLIKAKVIDEVEQKIARLKLPRGFSYRAVLIHVNGVSEDVLARQYFANVIDFGEFL